MHPSHPTDGLTLCGSLNITPPLDHDEVDVLHTIAISSFRAVLEEVSSGLVDRLAPGHPDGPSCWLPCQDGCCLEIDERGFARIDAIEPWLRYIVGTLLRDHSFSGALVMWDHAERRFTALAVEGSRVRRRPVLEPARSTSRRAGQRPRIVASV